MDSAEPTVYPRRFTSDCAPWYVELCQVTTSDGHDLAAKCLSPEDLASYQAMRDESNACWTVIADPEEALADRLRWPDHVCDGIGRTLVESWARRRATKAALTPLTQQSWTMRYPLAVGSEAIDEVIDDMPRIISGVTPEEPDLARFPLRACAVTSGNDHALLIVWAEIHTTMVTAFFLGKNVIDASLGDETDWWKPDRVVFEITGNPGDSAVHTFCEGARRWWKSLTKSRVQGTGRPRGTVTWSLDQIAVLLRQYAGERQQSRPSQQKFVAWLHEPGRDGPSDKTISHRLREAETTWAIWRDGVLA